MKRTFIVLMGLAVLVALAVPAGAAKGGKPGKPSAVGVSLEANLLWANAPGDTIFYTLTITKPADYKIEAITTEITGTGDVSQLVEESPGTYTQQYTVEGAFNEPDDWTDDLALDELVNTATVTFLNEQDEVVEAVATASVTVEPIKPCPEGIDSGVAINFEGGFCYHAFSPGDWEITLVPEKPSGFAFTMRDHVPGNWCMTGGGDEEARGRPRPGETLVMTVHLPDLQADWMDQGVCEVGGWGVCTEPDCYLPAGNPFNFVLAAAKGQVTATHLGP